MSDPRNPDEMSFRLLPGRSSTPQRNGTPIDAGRPPFSILITAADGAELLRLYEEDGRLKVAGDESRWDEAAKRFLHGMMQWSGQVGLQWKSEVLKAGGQ